MKAEHEKRAFTFCPNCNRLTEYDSRYGNDDDSGMSYWCTVCNFQLSEERKAMKDRLKAAVKNYAEAQERLIEVLNDDFDATYLSAVHTMVDEPPLQIQVFRNLPMIASALGCEIEQGVFSIEQGAISDAYTEHYFVHQGVKFIELDEVKEDTP